MSSSSFLTIRCQSFLILSRLQETACNSKFSCQFSGSVFAFFSFSSAINEGSERPREVTPAHRTIGVNPGVWGSRHPDFQMEWGYRGVTGSPLNNIIIRLDY